VEREGLNALLQEPPLKQRILNPHGSVGVILRAFREGILTENRVVKLLQNLESESTLFITHSLIQQAIKAVKDYSKE